MSPLIELEMEDESSLGPCCICETTKGVRNILMLRKKSPIPGRGWGCLVCGLSADGASAVLCDPCFERYCDGKAELRFACRGYPEIDGRVPYEDLEGTHDHDFTKHEEIMSPFNMN